MRKFLIEGYFVGDNEFIYYAFIKGVLKAWTLKQLRHGSHLKI